jgi:hypothetical protein
MTSFTPSTWMAGKTYNITIKGTGLTGNGTGSLCWNPGITFWVG